MNIQKVNNSNIAFSAVSKKQLSELAKIIEEQNPKYFNKPQPVAKMYQDGVDFLKGSLDKQKYLKELGNTLDKFTNKNNPEYFNSKMLSNKESTFIEHIEMTFDKCSDVKKLSKEELANHLSILA